MMKKIGLVFLIGFFVLNLRSFSQLTVKNELSKTIWVCVGVELSDEIFFEAWHELKVGEEKCLFETKTKHRYYLLAIDLDWTSSEGNHKFYFDKKKFNQSFSEHRSKTDLLKGEMAFKFLLANPNPKTKVQYSFKKI